MHSEPLFPANIDVFSDLVSHKKKQLKPPSVVFVLLLVIPHLSFLWCHEKAALCLFVLRFYGPVNPMGSCRARSVYLTTRLLGRLSPLSG